MADIVDMFTRERIAPPAAAESEYVADLEDDLGEMHSIFNAMLAAETEEEFKAQAADMKAMLTKWGI